METQVESKATLAELVSLLERSEDALEHFDPEVLVGTLKDKVDAIHSVLERMEAIAGYLSASADPLTRKARAIKKARERLKEYVAFQMKANGFSTLPGQLFKVNLQQTAEYLEIEVDRRATAKDATDYADYVQTDIYFSWNKEAIEKAFAEGIELPDFIKVQPKRTAFIKFYPNVPESLEPKKKKGKKA